MSNEVSQLHPTDLSRFLIFLHDNLCFVVSHDLSRLSPDGPRHGTTGISTIGGNSGTITMLCYTSRNRGDNGPSRANHISGACFDCRLSKRQHRLALTLAGELRPDGPDRGVTLGAGEHRLFRRRSQKRHAGGTRDRSCLR